MPRGTGLLLQGSDGSTHIISEAPTKIMGHLINSAKSKTDSAKKLESKLLPAVEKIDSRPIRGEYKTWILKHYLAPFIHLLLMIDTISEQCLTKIQSKLNKFNKKWLNLPRYRTLAAVYHPDVINLLFLPHPQEQAKERFQLWSSQSTRLSEKLFTPSERPRIRKLARYTPFFLLSARSCMWVNIQHNHDSCEKKSQTETAPKILECITLATLKAPSISWNHNLVPGTVLLPAYQQANSHSFFEPAQTVYQPHWICIIMYQAHVCNSPNPTTALILNSCEEALNQGRYTWRHDSVRNCLVNSVEDELPSTLKLYADILSWWASNCPPTTLPSNIPTSTSTSRPDIVLIEHSNIRLLGSYSTFQHLRGSSCCQTEEGK